jgi:hypothetical protein
MEHLRPDVQAGRVRVIQPRHPQPTNDLIAWTESAPVHRVQQRAFIKSTSN